jgi:hypothetical protein
MVDIVQNEVVGHQSQYLERDFLKKHDTRDNDKPSGVVAFNHEPALVEPTVPPTTRSRISAVCLHIDRRPKEGAASSFPSGAYFILTYATRGTNPTQP